MHTFKSYCASLFSKHVLLCDAKRIPVQQTKNVQVARQVRFTPVGEITVIEPVLKAYTWIIR